MHVRRGLVSLALGGVWLITAIPSAMGADPEIDQTVTDSAGTGPAAVTGGMEPQGDGVPAPADQRTYTVSGLDFDSDHIALLHHNASGCVSATANPGDNLVHSVNLPHGAHVNQVELIYYDVSGSDGMAYLTAYDGDGLFQDWATLQTSGSGGYGVATVFVDRVVDNTIESLSFNYRAEATDGSIRLCRMSVRYTLGTLRLWSEEAKLTVESDPPATEPRTQLQLRNNGPARFSLRNSDTGEDWLMAMGLADDFLVQRTGGGKLRLFRNGKMTVGVGTTSSFILDTAGNLTITGALTQGSDAGAKSEPRPVDAEAVLTAVEALPIGTWSYADDPRRIRHLGPTAQDFRQAFGLGGSDTGIAAVDADGVALAAIQALSAQVDERDRRISALERRLEAVERLLADG